MAVVTVANTDYCILGIQSGKDIPCKVQFLIQVFPWDCFHLLARQQAKKSPTVFHDSTAVFSFVVLLSHAIYKAS